MQSKVKESQQNDNKMTATERVGGFFGSRGSQSTELDLLVCARGGTKKAKLQPNGNLYQKLGGTKPTESLHPRLLEGLHGVCCRVLHALVLSLHSV